MEENNDLVDLWTSKFLSEFDRPRHTSRRENDKIIQVAFGRTTYPNTYVDVDRSLARSRALGRSSSQTSSLHAGTLLSDSRAHLTQQQRTMVADAQDSKLKGVQMLNFIIDKSKATEKRNRMSQYSREIRHGARSQLSREIDSITRLVVKSFKKMIDSERCALFLHDEKMNELYFKPVGDNDSHARQKIIRFPAHTGVAGWVATNKQCLNIPNAYKDHRFNSDIDTKTGFRTRTILCAPVLSSDNALLGVIQMVNKRKGDATEGMARKKTASSSHKGSSFEPFSKRDEDILARCCAEVSKSLQDIFAQYNKKTDSSKCLMKDQEEVIVEDEDDESSSSTDDERDESRAPPPLLLRSDTKRRSSVGTLAQFIKRNSLDISSRDHNGDACISEAILNFKFRSQNNNEAIQKREQARRESDSEYMQALRMRNRMNDYHKDKVSSQRV